MARNAGLAVVIAAGLVAACLALIVVSGMLELAVALAVVVVLIAIPGFLVSRAIAPTGWGDSVTQIAAAIGFGIAIAALGGIVLDWLGIRLAPISWLALFVVAALAGGAVAYTRGARIDDTTGQADRPSVRERRGLGLRGLSSVGPDWRPKSAELALLVVALILTAASIRIARVGLADQPQVGYTQLWILPATEARHADVGVTNGEGSRETYRLEVVRGSEKLGSWSSLDLADGATWSATVTLPATGTGPVEARLYRSTDPTRVYRSVSYWPPG